jgi:hypothetical protein
LNKDRRKLFLGRLLFAASMLPRVRVSAAPSLGFVLRFQIHSNSDNRADIRGSTLCAKGDIAVLLQQGVEETVPATPTAATADRRAEASPVSISPRPDRQIDRSILPARSRQLSCRRPYVQRHRAADASSPMVIVPVLNCFKSVLMRQSIKPAPATCAGESISNVVTAQIARF